MIRYITICSVVMIISLVCSGCDGDCDTPRGIYGEWTWIMTDDNHRGIITTPANSGNDEKLSIDDFTIKYFVNDSLVHETQYDLVISTDTLGQEENFLVFPSGYKQGIYVDDSQLILWETLFLFNPSHHYKRL